MYNGKPVVMTRPWWRHPIFPWGWYSLLQDRIEGDRIESDGYWHPDDHHGGVWEWSEIKSKRKADGWTIINPDEIPED